MNVLFCYIPEKQKFLALKKVIFFGLLGFILIFTSPYLSRFLPFNAFKLLPLLGIFLFIRGSLPYKKLSFLETYPHKIVIEKEFFIFYFFNLPLIKIKKNTVKDIKHILKKNYFGISLLITVNDEQQKIIFLEKRRKIIYRFLKQNFLKKTEKEILIFFPYFNENSCKRLKAQLNKTHFD